MMIRESMWAILLVAAHVVAGLVVLEGGESVFGVAVWPPLPMILESQGWPPEWILVAPIAIAFGAHSAWKLAADWHVCRDGGAHGFVLGDVPRVGLSSLLGMQVSDAKWHLRQPDGSYAPVIYIDSREDDPTAVYRYLAAVEAEATALRAAGHTVVALGGFPPRFMRQAAGGSTGYDIDT